MKAITANVKTTSDVKQSHFRNYSMLKEKYLSAKIFLILLKLYYHIALFYRITKAGK